MATYGLLGTMVAVFFLQNMTANNPALYFDLWLIWTDWTSRPWSLITSTLSHGGFSHLFFNGLMLFFFGPTLERLIGRRDFIILFFITGAAAGVLQVEISAQFGNNFPALGASGALMALFGTMAILWPNQKILVYGIVPIKFWIAAIGYAAIDVLGAFNPNDGIGNFAHLSGMVLGIAYGLGLKARLREIRVQRFGR